MTKPSAVQAVSLCCLSLAAAAIPAAPATAATLPTATVAVTPTSATIAGALQSGAVDVVTTGKGVKEASVILFRLNPGVTIAEVETFLGDKKAQNDPNNTSAYGSIVFDAEAGTEAAVSLLPGSYLLLTSEGEKPARLDEPFTVSETKAPVALPAAQATERTIDFGFRGPATLKDGEVVAFENEGFVVHMDLAIPVKSMKIAKKVVAALKSGHEKGLEKDIAGAPVTFAGPVSHGAVQEETIAAKPGIYVQVCFMSTQDGRPHTLLGMERIIKIVK